MDQVLAIPSGAENPELEAFACLDGETGTRRGGNHVS